MKLRTRGNSQRLRLTQSEVRALADGSVVEDVTEFTPTERFVVTLACHDEKPIAARFGEGRILVRVPRRAAQAWANGEDVAMSGDQAIAKDRALSILIEKDFACLKPRAGEDDSDAFPHPSCGSG
jgi:hypothetical protein